MNYIYNKNYGFLFEISKLCPGGEIIFGTISFAEYPNFECLLLDII